MIHSSAKIGFGVSHHQMIGYVLLSLSFLGNVYEMSDRKGFVPCVLVRFGVIVIVTRSLSLRRVAAKGCHRHRKEARNCTFITFSITLRCGWQVIVLRGNEVVSILNAFRESDFAGTTGIIKRS